MAIFIKNYIKITILIIAVAINTEASLFKAGNDWNDLKDRDIDTMPDNQLAN